MKSYTNIEQSKKLAEILPLESADMKYKEYTSGLDYSSKHCNVPSVGHPFSKDIPCWSLAALLDALPNNLQIALAINDFQGDRKEKYALGSVEHDKYDCYADNPVDACYEMILKLHERKLL